MDDVELWLEDDSDEDDLPSTLLFEEDDDLVWTDEELDFVSTEDDSDDELLVATDDDMLLEDLDEDDLVPILLLSDELDDIVATLELDDFVATLELDDEDDDRVSTELELDELEDFVWTLDDDELFKDSSMSANRARVSPGFRTRLSVTRILRVESPVAEMMVRCTPSIVATAEYCLRQAAPVCRLKSIRIW